MATYNTEGQSWVDGVTQFDQDAGNDITLLISEFSKLSRAVAFATGGDIPSTTGGATKDAIITFTEQYDPSSLFNPVTGVYTVGGAGTYLVGIFARGNTMTANDRMILYGYDGSTYTYLGEGAANTSGVATAAGVGIIHFTAAGSLSSAVVTSNAGAAIQFANLLIARIGD